jgi:hypothetical protein
MGAEGRDEARVKLARLVRAFASAEHRGWALLSAVVDLTEPA